VTAVESRVDLLRLTGLRAFAALVVFLHHVGYETNWVWQDRYLRHGYVGVAFFFVLSGFVLTWAWRPSDGLRLFYVRRLARIWPAHVAALVLAAAILQQVPGWRPLVANLLLVHAWAPDTLDTINFVSWSLSVEIFFYALAPAVIIASRRLPVRAFLAASVGLVILLSLVRVLWSLADGESRVLFMQPALRLSEFVTGVVVAVAVKGGWRPRIPVPVAVTVLAMLALALSVPRGDLPGALPEVILLPAFAVLIASTATADLAGLPGILQCPWVVYAGKVSFAFYLVHDPLLDLLLTFLTPFPSRASGVAYTLGAAAVSFAVAAVVHHLVERPAQRTVVRWADTRLAAASLR
jgi:peptidoglycan/LPS O-acetylase OafA/YrhL